MLFSELKSGQVAEIKAIKAGELHARRLYEMGFLPHTRISLEHVATLGSPVIAGIRGFCIVLGKKDADSIEVEVISE
ncbi:FeoA family protein [Succinimonas amylolytica]|uniref:FeoA family protein n=1 Tax=Succinimonas amylolytica TaxID=83769 RepID=UPI000362C261|nr:FeoA domain-containing protein [Succinimonas amylolytica]